MTWSNMIWALNSNMYRKWETMTVNIRKFNNCYFEIKSNTLKQNLCKISKCLNPIGLGILLRSLFGRFFASSNINSGNFDTLQWKSYKRYGFPSVWSTECILGDSNQNKFVCRNFDIEYFPRWTSNVSILCLEALRVAEIERFNPRVAIFSFASLRLFHEWYWENVNPRSFFNIV